MIILRQKEYGAAYKMKKALVRGRQAKRSIQDTAMKVAIDPRGMAKEGLAITAENPMTVASQIAATPVHVATAGAFGPAAQVVTAALPNSVPYVMGEAALKKHVPSYARATKKAGQAVRNSKTVDAALGVQPAVTYANAGPNATMKEKVKYNLRSGLADISNGVTNAGTAAFKLIRGYSKHD